jgi:hypothetical protein
MHLCIYAAVRLFRGVGCVAVWLCACGSGLCGSFVVWLCNCVAVRHGCGLYSCVVVWLCGCAAVGLVAVRLDCCLAVAAWLGGCVVVRPMLWHQSNVCVPTDLATWDRSAIIYNNRSQRHVTDQYEVVHRKITRKVCIYRGREQAINFATSRRGLVPVRFCCVAGSA